MNAPRILVIDDEPQVHRFLKPALAAAGYQAERADTGDEGLRLARLRPPAAILLDLGLPDRDGQEVLILLRHQQSLPVVVISARDRIEEKVRALDSGADDYVEKPFAIPELLARLRACLRRVLVHEAGPAPWRNEDLEVDLLRRQAAVEGKVLDLTAREYDLLATLVRHAGSAVTYRQLLNAVWGPQHIEQLQYVRVYVGHLRQKLGPSAAKLLRTETGVGYRLLDARPSSPPKDG